MPNPAVTAAIRAKLGPRLPGAVALLDIADAKTRNLYLGWRRVDGDIRELDGLAAEIAGAGAGACRVAGDQWLLAGALTRARLDQLLSRYDRTDQITARCISRARLGNQPWQETVRTSVIPIRRALRAVYRPGCRDLEELLAAWDSLQRAVKAAPVGSAVEVGEAGPTPGSFEGRWRSAENPCGAWACPLCGKTDITWTGGADDASEGVCGSCGAELDFRTGGV
ncbi:MAG TPA: hypothetical protein VGQ17_13150 [Gemmatimonadales bacterium]|jgi:hypothetical protein|nr:hypothetical protein [Gemmatimonadales bacterium]